MFGPAPWSSFDMEALGEEEDAVARRPLRSVRDADRGGRRELEPFQRSERRGRHPALDDEPTTHLIAEPDEIFVAEPDETFVAEPDEISSPSRDETFVAEPDEMFVAEPRRDVRRRAATRRSSPSRNGYVRRRAGRNVRRRAGGDLRRQAGCDAPRVGRQHRHAGIDRRRAGGLVARARAVAGHHPRGRVACTRRRPRRDDHARGHDAIGRARGGPRPRRGAYERGNGNGRRSSIDVDGRDRPASDVSASPITREDGSPKHGSTPRRSGSPTSRRHNGPKPITWRARAH